MDNIWRSSLSRQLKVNFFRATIESILIYGAETWTLTEKLNAQIDGTYTRLLRHALNINWKQHVTNEHLYGNLPKSRTILARRLSFAGHCSRGSETASTFLLWKPRHGRRGPGRPTIDYVAQLTKDTGLDTAEMEKAMRDRGTWKAIQGSLGLGAPD